MLLMVSQIDRQRLGYRADRQGSAPRDSIQFVIMRHSLAERAIGNANKQARESSCPFIQSRGLPEYLYYFATSVHALFNFFWCMVVMP